MISKSITINIPAGEDAARPAALMVQVANQFESSIYVAVDDMKVNAKSIMGMMSVRLEEGRQVGITANGSDETEAIQKIEDYLTNKQ